MPPSAAFAPLASLSTTGPPATFFGSGPVDPGAHGLDPARDLIEIEVQVGDLGAFPDMAFERRVLKDQVMEFLWPEAVLSAAANNLYKTLHVIRRTFETAFGSQSADAIFRFEGGILTLLPDVWVDTAEFEQLAASGTGKN